MELLPSYHHYQHQVVRDLAWCCFSPPLLGSLPGSDAEIWRNRCARADKVWLDALDRDPAALINHLAENQSTRLGLYYENLLKFYWQHQPHIRLLAHNLQIDILDNNTGRKLTYGAVDFLIQSEGSFWHLEAAVKFYLGVPDREPGPGNWYQWLGPNCDDRLDIKLERLRQHQLPLSQQPLAQPLLERFNSGAPWRRGLCLQGYLFYPGTQAMAAPHAGHPQHLRGSWWHLTEFTEDINARKNGGIYWLIVPRPRWLAPAQTTDIQELYATQNLLDALQHWVGEIHRPQLIAAMKKEGNLWIETARSFIVPDHWPWNGRPSRST